MPHAVDSPSTNQTAVVAQHQSYLNVIGEAGHLLITKSILQQRKYTLSTPREQFEDGLTFEEWYDYM